VGAALSLAALAWAGPARAAVVRLEALEAQVTAERSTVETARVAAASARVELAESAYYPQLAVSAEGSLSPGGRLVRVADLNGTEYLVQGTRTLDESGAFTPQPRYGVALTAQQRLYDFGRTAAAVRAAEADQRAARAADVAQRGTRVRVLRGAYLRWVGAWIAREAITRQRNDARARRALVEGRVGEGVRAPSDLGALEVHEAEIELDAVRAEGNLAAAKLDVERASGAPLPEGATPDAAILEREPPKAPRDGEGDSMVQSLDSQRDAALAAARAAELGRAPILSATAEAGLHGQSVELFPEYRGSVTLVVPLWDGGATSARVAAARAHAAELSARGTEARQQRSAARARASLDLASAAATLAAAERLRDAAARVANAAEERYALGQGPVEPVLEARAALARAEHEVLVAKLARAEASMTLGGP
jgi:outer membrane protein TolC